ncbi:1-acyl-sn-glycerol-3-phosphate acyltransferase gamma [Perognathus longimembris pacificus]|uniref:1-acyl-sn-glycerol-3-phosphate acyltransferase gamma n=1 Tax=Perognathus longimembris pacificus TaxID=214514 RepID=UPI002018F4D1|nr:1-acyl-sn-glycerol-3-phosphate acyltransferase gamma [Perognathus longimembris pacificus]
MLGKTSIPFAAWVHRLASRGRWWRPWAREAQAGLLGCGVPRRPGPHPTSSPRDRRFPLEDIPVDEKGAAQWLHKLYQEKDALQEMYKEKGEFPGERIKPARRPWTLLNFLCWAAVLLSLLFSFVLGIFASGSPLLILTFLGFVGAAAFGLRRLIGVTEIGKGSSYGNQELKKKE